MCDCSCRRHADRNRTALQDSLLAREQLKPQGLGVCIRDVGHRGTFVRRTAGRLDLDRAHARQTLQYRCGVVDRLHALVGNVHALLGEDAGIEAELLFADLVEQMPVAPNLHHHPLLPNRFPNPPQNIP